MFWNNKPVKAAGFLIVGTLLELTGGLLLASQEDNYEYVSIPFFVIGTLAMCAGAAVCAYDEHPEQVPLLDI
jgi:hypothetical protein